MTNTTDKAKPYYQMLWLICLMHMINDTVTAIVPALLPVFQKEMGLNYTQLGMVVFVATVLASFLQPLVGILSDKKSMPYLLPVGAALCCLGVIGISQTSSYLPLLFMVGLIGLGSAVFHPEASRVAHAAAGPRKGLGQSIFQVGGNFGQSIGPLMIALIFIPFGQHGAAMFAVLPLLAIIMLMFVARWYKGYRKAATAGNKAGVTEEPGNYKALWLLVFVVIMRSWINSGVASFLPLWLVNDQGKSIEVSQYYTFVFLFAGVVGTFLGGVVSDWISKKKILIFSMIGSVPFTLIIPYLDGFWLYVDIFLVGLISLCSFAVTVVYAQQMVPGKVGFVSGMMIGFAIGASGVGATVLGLFADSIGIVAVIELLVVFPIIGTIASIWLPETDRKKRPVVQTGTVA